MLMTRDHTGTTHGAGPIAVKAAEGLLPGAGNAYHRLHKLHGRGGMSEDFVEELLAERNPFFYLDLPAG